ncbi:DUF2474 domain-containing protein [Roseiarcaceae bacterium H3SJ34-1]|nr:DUF2474 domain-containing protein [Roseiarcaceae bacterium H3SJ34-1]
MRREETQEQKPLLNRLAWFIGLWVLGVASVGAIGLLIRLALR